MKKTCPRCENQVRDRAARCRRCRYRFPEQSSPQARGPCDGRRVPAVRDRGPDPVRRCGDLSPALIAISMAMVVAGVVLFFDPR